jgi:hypothetical protein
VGAHGLALLSMDIHPSTHGQRIALTMMRREDDEEEKKKKRKKKKKRYRGRRSKVQGEAVRYYQKSAEVQGSPC